MIEFCFRSASSNGLEVGDEFRQQFKQAKYFSSKEWRAKMNDGSVTQWLQGVTDFFVKTGNIQNPVPANKYFDPSVYLEAIKG